MLDWISKYKVRVPGAAKKPSGNGTADPAATAAAKEAKPAHNPSAGPKPGAAPQKAAPPAPTVDWAALLQAALGDDQALLALAQQAAAPLQTKLDAVAALASEEALKTAEREFRSHNRRVHSLAKQRLQAQRAQREARAEAARLIEAAQALAAETLIPVNSAVELDRAWSALDSSLLAPEQRERFAALTAQLSGLTRQRAELEAGLKRWQAEARHAQQALQTACTQAASGEQPASALVQAQAAAQAVVSSAPAGAEVPVLQQLVATAQTLQERLALLDRVLTGAPAAPAPATDAHGATEAGQAPPTQDEQQTPQTAGADAATTSPETAAAAETATPSAADAAPPPKPRAPRPPTAAQQWLATPPLADTRLAALLQARFEAWQRTQEDARQQQKAQRREQAKEQKQAVRSERVGALEAVLAQAEARLAEGQVAQTHQHLVEIDELLHGGALANELRARIDRLQEGYAELRGWQHWAGGRARDDLAQEATALAARCAPGPDGQPPKLQLKEHAEHIDNLRERWKELDRLGGATSRALWQRFDGALKAAYEPVAAARAAQSAVREQNLAARRLLLDALEAVPLPAPEDGNADLRPVVAALDQFRVEWRKLGPLEHTVPRKAQDRLVQRMDAAVQRLHEPVDAARQGATRERQGLIDRAQALAAYAQEQAKTQNPGLGSAGGPPGRGPVRDMVAEVRALQGQWQQSAQGLPLPRQLENALWQQFRTALDAVFSAREAVFSARDAEFKAHADERIALIERLEALVETLDAAPPHETKRTLAELDTHWQRCGPAPRAQAGALEDRYRRARDAVQQGLAGSRQRSWNATCDALATKLALCEAHERGAAAAELLQADWAALPALPAAWETVLRQRAGLVNAEAGAAGTAHPADAARAALPTDAVLLQLEAAWNLPSPPAQAAARRELQLQAMKAALETRRTPAAAATATTPEQWLAEALRRPLGADAAHQQRLGAVLAALRQRGPAAT